MPTPFSYDYVFRVDSPATLAAAYFEPAHLAAQDVVAELTDRTVTAETDDGTTKAMTWRVVSKRPLPAIARPFVGGTLVYLETMSWKRDTNAIELSVIPQILKARVQIHATYKLQQVGDMQVERTYAGAVTAGIALIGGKIERGIVAAFDESMGKMAKCTQDWLNAR
jgi:Protein of unknown function (DUF2505)